MTVTPAINDSNTYTVEHVRCSMLWKTLQLIYPDPNPATAKSAAMIDEHMQDQYFCTDRADVAFKNTQMTWQSSRLHKYLSNITYFIKHNVRHVEIINRPLVFVPR